MYSISGYGEMIADRVRAQAHAAALAAAVRPGDVVMDLGAGTGVLSLLACRLGARKVYAVEPGPALRIARELARANGMADRIECVAEDSTRLTLPEPVDVLVADLRGVLPLFRTHLSVLADARRRHLKPGGTLIPLRDHLWAAPVHAPELHARQVSPADEEAFGFDVSAARAAAASEWHRARLGADSLLAEPARWATLDYARQEGGGVRGSAAWTFPRAAAAHGVLVWFEAELAPGIGFSTGPEAPETLYRSGFFPWPAAVELRADDRVEVELRADPLGGDFAWTWATRVLRGGAEAAAFRQTDAFGALPDPAVLRRGATHHRPVLSDSGRVTAAVLARMDGSRDLADIAAEVAAAFPDRFPDAEAALPHVRRLAREQAR